VSVDCEKAGIFWALQEDLVQVKTLQEDLVQVKTKPETGLDRL
jgi:hypothetical protein